MKRQEDEGDADPSIEELCHDRPADEYFRLNTNGDCRDVVRYVHRPLEYSCSPATVDRSVSRNENENNMQLPRERTLSVAHENT